jgi:hypothetical protein
VIKVVMTRTDEVFGTHRADPADKADVYRQLGIKLTYQPDLRLIQAEASPDGSCTQMCPRGDLNPHALYGH